MSDIKQFKSFKFSCCNVRLSKHTPLFLERFSTFENGNLSIYRLTDLLLNQPQPGS